MVSQIRCHTNNTLQHYNRSNCIVNENSSPFDLVRILLGTIVPFWVLMVFLLTGISPAQAQTIDNTGFENALTPWTWTIGGGANATGTVVSGGYAGNSAFRFTNTSALAANVYGRLSQTVTNLKPNTDYVVGAWVKGTNVGKCWIGGGPTWGDRFLVPTGTYNWQFVQGRVRTGPNSTSYALMMLTESPTTELLVDNVVFQTLNRVVNPSFENTPLDWSWGSGVSTATGQVSSEAYTGSKSYRITNSSPFTPGVYGRLYQTITGLRPDTDYKIGLWIKGQGVTRTWVGGGPNWNDRTDLPMGNYGWRFFQADVHTGPTATTYELLITTEGIVGELLVDDVEFVDAAYATDGHIYGVGVTSDPSATSTSITVNRTAGAYGANAYDQDELITGEFVETSNVARPVQSQGLILYTKTSGGTLKEYGRTSLPSALAQQKRSTRFMLPASFLTAGTNYQFQLTIINSDGSVASNTLSSSFTRKDLSSYVSTLLPAAQTRYNQVLQLAQQNGVANNAYVILGLNVSQQFITRVQNGGQRPYWEWLEMTEVLDVLDETEQIINDGPPYGNSTGPGFRGGYGHFSSVASFLPNFSKYGVSLIQQERGPNNLNANGTANGITSIVNTLQTAAANNVQVDLLLSPHYFPQWAITQNQQGADDLLVTNSGSIRYNVDHPEARAVIQDWLEAIVPAVKNEAGLHSLNISNEAIYQNSGRDIYSRAAYNAFLQARHGTIANLNTLYGQNYASFSAVPVPAATPVPNLSTASIGDLRRYFDWLQFNNQNFANWHLWMNGIIKGMAPNVKTHAKVMAPHSFDRNMMYQGMDPELIGEITDYAGNDISTYMTDWGLLSGSLFSPSQAADFAYSWQRTAITADYQHSIRGQMVFNSENHFIPDGHQARVPAEFTRAVMWQGGIHNIGASIGWVWENAPNANSVFEGCVYYRPSNMFSIGRAYLDLNRLNPDVTSVKGAASRVAILRSNSSIYWNPEHVDALRAAYTASVFNGEKVTFVTEKQLLDGNIPNVSCIIVPQVTHTPAGVVTALQSFASGTKKLILVGSDNMKYDQYNRTRTIPTLNSASVTWTNDDRTMAPRIRTALAGIFTINSLYGAGTTTQMYGIEYRYGTNGTRKVLSLMNMLKQSQTVAIPAASSTTTYTDLVTGKTVNATSIPMASMQMRLLLINAGSSGSLRSGPSAKAISTEREAKSPNLLWLKNTKAKTPKFSDLSYKPHF